VPTDPSTATANATSAPSATSRRTFLTRTAMGGALVTAGVIAAPAIGLGGATVAGADTLDDSDYVYFAGPLELAAVEIYQAALDNSVVDPSSDTFSMLQDLQQGHSAAATAIASQLPTTATPAVAAPGFTAELKPGAAQAKSVEALMQLLAGVEDQLSATHLSALESIVDAVTAKAAAQILAAEAQNAAALGLMGGGKVSDLSPAEGSTDGAIKPGDVDGAPAPTTTTTAAN
jgi:hypothetical protein